jgi:hypothetical protein
VFAAAIARENAVIAIGTSASAPYDLILPSSALLHSSLSRRMRLASSHSDIRAVQTDARRMRKPPDGFVTMLMLLGFLGLFHPARTANRLSKSMKSFI